MEKKYPWIEVIKLGNDLHTLEGNLSYNVDCGEICALFATQISPKSFSEIEKWKWGWNSGALYNEVVDRQRLFIESQHPSDDLLLQCNHSFALRCLNIPSRSEIKFSLVGKVYSSDETTAQYAAREYWEEIAAIFPYDYNVLPITKRDEFLQVAGWEHLSRICKPDQYVEICRFEACLPTGNNQVYALGNWQYSEFANEQIWRAISGCSKPIMLSITLHPINLHEDERLWIIDLVANIEKSCQQTASDSSIFSSIRIDAEWAAEQATRLKYLRYPYLLQIQLVGPLGIPNYLTRAIGSALTHSDSDGQTPGYQVIRIDDETQLQKAKTMLKRVDIGMIDETIPDIRFQKLRYISGIQEVIAALRLPFPPKVGLPGVSIFPISIQDENTIIS